MRWDVPPNLGSLSISASRGDIDTGFSPNDAEYPTLYTLLMYILPVKVTVFAIQAILVQRVLSKVI